MLYIKKKKSKALLYKDRMSILYFISEDQFQTTELDEKCFWISTRSFYLLLNDDFHSMLVQDLNFIIYKLHLAI